MGYIKKMSNDVGGNCQEVWVIANKETQLNNTGGTKVKIIGMIPDYEIKGTVLSMFRILHHLFNSPSKCFWKLY